MRIKVTGNSIYNTMFIIGKQGCQTGCSSHHRVRFSETGPGGKRSNTAIVESGGETLFIDCGYAFYREEMVSIFRKPLPDWVTMKKRILITHADVDHLFLRFRKYTYSSDSENILRGFKLADMIL